LLNRGSGKYAGAKKKKKKKKTAPVLRDGDAGKKASKGKKKGVRRSLWVKKLENTRHAQKTRGHGGEGSYSANTFAPTRGRDWKGIQ